VSSRARNRLLLLGVLWGLLLAAVPAVVMADPYEPDGFLVAGMLAAVASGAAGALVAGRRAARAKERGGRAAALRSGLGTGLVQGLVGGGAAALLIWVLMALTLSGFSLRHPVEISALMRPQVFLGSFFVSLSVFLYSLAGGLVLGPAFGVLVNRTARAGTEGGS
jgi:hypothetical protein